MGLSFSARKGGGAGQEGNEAMEQADRRGKIAQVLGLLLPMDSAALSQVSRLLISLRLGSGWIQLQGK